MSAGARVAVWLAHLLDHEGRTEQALEAFELAADLDAVDWKSPRGPALIESAERAWCGVPGTCPKCGTSWPEMRRDGVRTSRAGHWEQRYESRTCAACTSDAKPTISRLIAERDVQELCDSDPELEALAVGRPSVPALAEVRAC